MSDSADMMQDGPATVAEAVTPADSADLTNQARALYVGVSGNVKVTLQGGDVVTFQGLLAGQVYPFAVTRVWSGTTTAASMMALR